MKIVILDGYTLNPGDLSWDAFRALGDFTVYDRTAPGDIIGRIHDADIVYTNKTLITGETLEACPNIRFIGVLATGYNVVDTKAAEEKNIPVANVPAYSTASVAQHTFALLLELCLHIGAHSDSVRQGDWTNSKDFCYWKYPLIELAGKTMGIIGFGRIGQAVANIAAAFGMKVLSYNKDKRGQGPGGITYVGLEQLLSLSDVISLHCPLFPATEKIINANSISGMKDGILLINTSRGPLIDENDLAEALKTGKVGGAALDVVSAEPIRSDNPLLNAPNCLITPHIAWAPLESRQRLMDTSVNNLKAYIAGSPINIVNAVLHK